MASRLEAHLEGGCTCRFVRYRVTGKPLIVHCCHCTWCQRETGSAFVINALFSSDNVTHLGEQPVMINTPSLSGKGQIIARCPKCHVAVWSNYPGGGPVVRFVRVGTLDQPHEFVPDVHIYTQAKVPWVKIPSGVPAYQEFYDPVK
ncbi:putative glutathione-dependent formaldehyde-activating enzyme, partial [Madurella mycetomatis]